MPAEPALADKVAFLLRQAWPGTTVEEIETHMSLVFLVSDRAYKLKKPVVYNFLDHRTVEARRKDCEAEVALNQRLAPGVYLGVESLTVDESGALGLGGDGEIVDWLVVMRRLHRGSLLDQLITAGVATMDGLEPVVDLLVDFYRSAQPRPERPAEYRRRLADLVSLGVEDLRAEEFGLDPELVDRIGGELLERIATTDALDERSSHLVDGHGDLRPEHIRPGSSPLVIDRLSFDARLRRVDPLFDLALLAVECECLGAATLGQHMLSRYSSLAGDPVPAEIVELYQALRATTRARLSIAHLRDDPPDRDKWIRRCHTYLGIARRHLDERDRRLVTHPEQEAGMTATDSGPR